MTDRIPVNEKLLSANDQIAGRLRSLFQSHAITVLNLVSSPGSGKTSLLEHTLRNLNDRWRIAVIAGDVQTENDANRLKSAGGRIVRPIITGGACHLDARMIEAALTDLPLDQVDLLFIENVGNLVCPSGFDLGENMKVVLISTTEGDDKPLKYPAMFRKSSVMVVNKTDLLGTSDFHLDTVRANARRINGNLHIIELSCRTGEGLSIWYEWLGSLLTTGADMEPQLPL